MGIVGVCVALAISVALLKTGAPVASGQEPSRADDEDRVRPTPKMVPQRQWEYKVVVVCAPTMAEGPTLEEELDATFNEQGKRGWELASLVSAADLSLVSALNTRGRRGEARGGRYCWLATFKRDQVH
jgi:hypothetical protein